MNFQFPDLTPVLPEAFLVLGALLLLLIDLSIKNKNATAFISLVLLMVTGFTVYSTPSGVTFGGMFSVDAYSSFFKYIFILSAAMAILVSGRYLRWRNEEHGEYYTLILLSTAGMMIMASAADLITIYLGLELMALSTYVLAGFIRGEVKSNESALKYFLLGAFSSAFLLYGISLIYGLTGITRLNLVASAISESGLVDNPVLFMALLMFVVAFGFKVAAAPFHMWAPDVYEGAPTPVTAFMSVGPKAAGFAVMARVFLVALHSLQADWTTVLVPIAILTMAVGNIIALSQQNIKRMLAYSSIAHAGYALIGLITGTSAGISAMMNYLIIYAFMNIGAFSIVIILDKGRVPASSDRLDNFKGLAKTHPVPAFLMLIFMFSLTGIPPTAGFMGKFYLFMNAVEAGYTFVVLAAVFFSVISAYFYLRVVKFMYMEEPEEGEIPAASMSTAPVSITIVLAVTALAVLLIGVYPEALLAMAKNSALIF